MSLSGSDILSLLIVYVSLRSAGKRYGRKNNRHREIKEMSSRFTTILVITLLAGNAWTEETKKPATPQAATGTGSSNTTNAANNPANPTITVDLQNYFTPSPAGYSGRTENLGYLRVSVPVDKFGLHQYIRTILPISTTPIVQGGPDTGAGRPDRLRLSAESVQRDHDRSWPAYRGTDGQRDRLRSWEMAGWRCRNSTHTALLGAIGRSSNLCALLLWKQFKPRRSESDGAATCSLQLPSWFLLPIYGSLELRNLFPCGLYPGRVRRRQGVETVQW